jgi:hypothetical protein
MELRFRWEGNNKFAIKNCVCEPYSGQWLKAGPCEGENGAPGSVKHSENFDQLSDF